MNSDQVALVQSSWESVLPISETAAELFYNRLFETDPSSSELFIGVDMKEQGQKLMSMIGTAVEGLDQPETIVPAVQDLGRRHARYGVTDQHYDSVGAALLWTLEQGLGETFTPDVKGAWAEAYVLLSSLMREAAASNA